MQAAGISTTSMVTNPTWKVGIWWQGHPGLFTVDSTHHNSDGGVHLPCVDRTHGRAFCGFPNEVEFFVEPLMDSLDLVWKPWPPLRTVSNTSIPHQQAPFRTPFPMDLNEFAAPFPAVSCKWISVGFLLDFWWISVAQDLSVNFCFHQLAWISENMSIVLLIKSIKMEQKYKSPP